MLHRPACAYLVGMARDPNVPDAFDVYTVVILRRPADAPDLPEAELDSLQARHLAYRAEYRDDMLTMPETLAALGRVDYAREVVAC